MKNDPSVAIVVPIYKDSFNDYERFSFYHNAEVLHKRDIFLIGPKRLKNHIRKLAETLENGKVTIFDDYYFNNTLRRNALLLMDINFYKMYKEFDYILICHCDAIIFKDSLNDWTSKQFDNIGSPLFNNKYTYKTRPGNNGGLCLRKVESCLKVLSETKFTYSRISSVWKLGFNTYDKFYRIFRDVFIYNYKWIKLRPVLHEDLYWSVIVPEQFPWFKNAPFEFAKYFAFEEKAKMLYKSTNQTLPFGIHAWWKYDEGFCMKLIQKKFPKSKIPGIKKEVFKIDLKSNIVTQ